MATTAYGIESMKEIADIENHIEFLNMLQKKYNWGKSIRKKLDSDLALIEKKKNDKTLHLSIVGEFSCGKSTFINALLRDNMLEADLIQGTTVASTIIRYADKLSVIVNFKDGSQAFFNEENVSDTINGGIKDIIKDSTTNDKLAAQIKEVIIEHPAAALSDGISIIDTPGTNSLERWHEDVTKAAIRDISDASIILTSAEQPLPGTLNAFIKANLGDVIGRCVFVVTKMDLIREKERNRQLKYIEQKITNEFGIEKPVILPYTPLFVLGEAVPEVKKEVCYTRDDYGKLVNQSYQTETQIYRILSEQRIIIQVQKLLSVMDDMLSYISSDMKCMTEAFLKSHSALEKAAKRDLREFTTEMERKYCGAFRRNAQSLRQNIMNSVYNAVETEKENIETAFNTCGTTSALTEFKNKLSELLEQSSLTIQNRARNKYGKIRKESYGQIEAFWEEFQMYYNELDSLAVKRAPEFNANNIKATVQLYSQAAITAAIQELDSHENKWMGGGAAGGAAIGTMIAPGIGTVIGALAGLFIGAVQSDKKFEEFKSKVWSGVSTVMDGYFREVVCAVECDVNDYIGRIDSHMREQIDDCLTAYKSFVDQKIRDNNEKKRHLEQGVASLRKDALEIENRHQKIKSIGERIKSIGSNSFEHIWGNINAM